MDNGAYIFNNSKFIVNISILIVFASFIIFSLFQFPIVLAQFSLNDVSNLINQGIALSDTVIIPEL